MTLHGLVTGLASFSMAVFDPNLATPVSHLYLRITVRDLRRQMRTAIAMMTSITPTDIPTPMPIFAASEDVAVLTIEFLDYEVCSVGMILRLRS